VPNRRRASLSNVSAFLSLPFAIISLVIAVLSYFDSRSATETSMKAFDVATQPSLTLACAFEEANLKRKPFSHNVVLMAPAGSTRSTLQYNFSEVTKTRDLDMVGDQDAWACALRSYSRIPLLNVALRFPLLVSDRPAATENPNYVICLNEIPAIPVDGEFRVLLVNGSKHQEILFAPLPAMVTVPSLGRVSTQVTLVGDQDFFFRALAVGPVEKQMKDAAIDDTKRLHCAREQDNRDRDFQKIQDYQDRVFGS
jgi:hypothetical protein